ncbi:uncharacterized protein Ecym_1301 [Eremothecium cymbalariae DBVPG|uniref:Uncharacterized protein n=1 Tax=Eremothecium cymbalariae (strain CBS 270.75 / DBVPG 7215 / KCTC 17166 / NRRL Y-17582) TaxID=931890 RepID=G8JN75_ERECY|nr:hypothetical protein Ecym_1301 [Eremothecium cymbalariae DBVPG\
MLRFVLHTLVWTAVMVGLLFLAHRKREAIKDMAYSMAAKLKLKFGGYIRINDHFVEDMEAGLSSRNFNILSSNSQDPRSGLDEVSKEEIRRIMQHEDISFDKARLIYTTKKFSENGIAPDGTPLDPKAITFAH